MKKTYLNFIDFDFWSCFLGFFDVMNRFIMFSKMFYTFLDQNELKNRFLGK